MGTIISKIEEIEHIRWTTPRKGRVVAAKRVLFVDDGAAIIELATGEFTVAGRHHTPNGNWAVLGYGLDRFTGGVLDGLVKLGILTKEHVKAHKNNQKKRHDESERRWAEKSLAKACETLGIPVPEVS